MVKFILDGKNIKNIPYITHHTLSTILMEKQQKYTIHNPSYIVYYINGKTTKMDTIPYISYRTLQSLCFYPYFSFTLSNKSATSFSNSYSVGNRNFIVCLPSGVRFS